MHPEIVRHATGDYPICGMALVPIAGTGEADDTELRDLTRRFWTGAALSIPLVILAMAPMVGFDQPFSLLPRVRGWVEFVLGTPVVLWVDGRFCASSGSRSPTARSTCTPWSVSGCHWRYLFSLAAVFVPGVFPHPA